MTNTPNLNITPVSQAQSQKEVTINTAFQLLDMLQNNTLKNQTLTAPPGSPSEGDLYLVATSPTGAWSGQAGKLAYYINASWSFISPRVGLQLWDSNLSKIQIWTGSAFIDPVTADNSFSTLGVNATPNSTNKLSVSSSAILFNHIGGDCKVFINKNASANGATVIFEDGFSERAEFGCIGDDTFQLKVSPDGSTFYQSFVIDNSTGNVDFKQFTSFEKGLKVKEGSNLYMGVATLSSGTVTVSNNAVTSTSRIFLTTQSPSGTVGCPYISARTAATSFTITSTSGSDNSTIAWQIINPA